MFLTQQKKTFPLQRPMILWQDYFLCLAFTLISRLFPHIPDGTALTGLCLLSGWTRSFSQAVGMICLSLTLSNILLSICYGWPLIGWWTCFMYSGFIGIIGLAYLTPSLGTASFLKKTPLLLFSSLGYWIWTNFGVWLEGWYGYSMHGFMLCHTMALPYLRQSMIGDLAWFFVVVFFIVLMQERKCFSFVNSPYSGR
jgi:hypothetical protein